MTATELVIGRPDTPLALSIDYVTKTAAVVAQRRKGKTYTANVMAEELIAAGIPWVALDPTGAWWGLRSSADGESPGLPVVVIGGNHGDVPLDRHMGVAIADLVLDHPGWYVIDMSGLLTRAAEVQFATAFAERLYRRKGQEGMDFPLHLFVDEADMFVPQDKEAGENKMLGAFQAIVRRGGLFGFGITLITQRPALVSKSVLTQLDVLVILRLVGPQDVAAIDAYVKRAASKAERDELLATIGILAIGEAIVWEPGGEPVLFARVRIRERRTFNSSATPKVGEQRVEPRRLADVDLDAVKVAMVEALERADRDDPEVLRAKLAEAHAQQANTEAGVATLLERIAELEQRPPAVELKIAERVVHRTPHEAIDHLREIATLAQSALPVLSDLASVMATHLNGVDTILALLPDEDEVVIVDERPPLAPDLVPWRPEEGLPVLVKDTGPRPSAPARPTPGRTGLAPGTFARKAERVILATLQANERHHPEGIDRAVLGFLSGYAHTGGAFGNALGTLRANGYVWEARMGVTLVQATPLGLTTDTGEDGWCPGPAILAEWRSRTTRAAERKMLDLIVSRHPTEWDRSELAAEAGYEPTGGAVGNALGSLRKLGLVERGRLTLTPAFASAIGRDR